jgi:hypothetical protein
MRQFAFASAAVAAAAIFTAAAPAAAETLIGFTDNYPLGGATVFIGPQKSAAVNWTQTVAIQNATLSVLVNSNMGYAGAANWWLTTALGPAATAGDIVASGTYQIPTMAYSNNFDTLARTTLTTGLDLAAGGYYLVLSGLEAPPNDYTAQWIGDGLPTVTLADGFTLGGYTSSQTGGPFGAFTSSAAVRAYVFGLEGDLVASVVPEPGAWALMLAGFGAMGAMLRRRGRVPATA